MYLKNTGQVLNELKKKHLIQFISSLLEAARLEFGFTDEGDIQNVKHWYSGYPTVHAPETLSHGAHVSNLGLNIPEYCIL